jgi:hypothetical protein
MREVRSQNKRDGISHSIYHLRFSIGMNALLTQTDSANEKSNMENGKCRGLVSGQCASLDHRDLPYIIFHF